MKKILQLVLICSTSLILFTGCSSYLEYNKKSREYEETAIKMAKDYNLEKYNEEFEIEKLGKAIY